MPCAPVVGQYQFPAVTFGDGVGNGQAEPCALLFAAQDAVEGVEYAPAFFRRNAGAVVFNPKGQVCVVVVKAKIDLA